MFVSVIFSNLDLNSIPCSLHNELRERIKASCMKLPDVCDAEVELFEGKADKSDIDVYVNISSDFDNIKGIRQNFFCNQIKKHIIEFEKKAKSPRISSLSSIYIGFGDDVRATDADDEMEEFDYRRRSVWFTAKDPAFSFEMLVVAERTRSELLEAASVIEFSDKLYNEWGLKETTPKSLAINFYGEPGTGKTMAAHAFASYIGKKIIIASYADIESKYHGEGPKMLKALFVAARDNDAVVFIDEADSLLSRRLQNVTQGSEQAINSMRSQLLILLEEHDTIVIFATNLIENYDKAFITRLNCIKFELPDADTREKIWNVHLFPTAGNSLNIPLCGDISVKKLASDYDFCGRDIREAVKYACINTLMNKNDTVTMENLIYGCNTVAAKKDAVSGETEHKYV